MKKTLLALALLALAGAAHATSDTVWGGATRSAEPATLVTVVKSSDIIVGVSVASQTATSIVIDKTQMYRWAEVQNKGANDVVCGENAATISTVAATLSGWVVDASTGVKRFDIVPGYDFFCQSRNVSGSTRVSVYRGR